MNEQGVNLDPKNHERIATAIGFIMDHYHDQPRLEDIASQAGLSSWHFNRLFRTWAGITPKQLVQFLSLRAAKASLDQHASILSASLNAGLSGPGRLHDLFVTIEAMTPGEYKNGGAGLALAYGFSASPFGDVLLAGTRRGLSHLSFVDQGRDRAIDELSEAWPNATLAKDDEGMSDLAKKIFSGGGKSLKLRLKGTNFQIQVWQALLKIPSGNQTSYSELAESIDRPSSHRAVANAVGRNPVAWLIPCHRVLRASGALGGYRWGVDRKAEILTWELAQHL